jgi:ubiquitin-conjugating enzyme E2 S
MVSRIFIYIKMRQLMSQLCSQALPSAALRRLTKELTQLAQSPPEGIRVVLNESDILDFESWVAGPSAFCPFLLGMEFISTSGHLSLSLSTAGTPYDSGYFRVRFTFTNEFPSAPPKCHFVTKIFHPNVAPTTGEICVNTLKKDWKKEYGIGHVLVTVKW